jgi:hypothetical protein
VWIGGLSGLSMNTNGTERDEFVGSEVGEKGEIV